MGNETAARVWLLMAAGDDRGHGGNAGYDDRYDAYYSWDSKVPSHKAIHAGDPVAVWDKSKLLGVSVIEETETWPGTNSLSRCVNCGTTRISLRKNSSPLYRCMCCKTEFDIPVVEVVAATLYPARYDAAWTALGVPGQEVGYSLLIGGSPPRAWWRRWVL